MSNSPRLSCVDVAVMLSETPFDFLSLRLDLELSEPAKNQTLAMWTRPGETQRGGASQCEGWGLQSRPCGELPLHSPYYCSPKHRKIDYPLASMKEMILLSKYSELPLSSVY